MSASIEPGRSPAPNSARPWRAADAAFVALSLAGLAAGLFPECFLPGHVVSALACPPALQALLACQAGWLLLVAPQVMRKWTSALCEYLLLLLASVPFYAVAAWVADAAAGDVVRGVLYLSSVALGAWGLGQWAGQSGQGSLGRSLVALLSAVAVVGLPALHYLLADFAGSTVDWLWRAGPVTCGFSTAASRGGDWRPWPLWAWALWPVIGALAALARAALRV